MWATQVPRVRIALLPGEAAGAAGLIRPGRFRTTCAGCRPAARTCRNRRCRARSGSGVIGVAGRRRASLTTARVDPRGSSSRIPAAIVVAPRFDVAHAVTDSDIRVTRANHARRQSRQQQQAGARQCQATGGVVHFVCSAPTPVHSITPMALRSGPRGQRDCRRAGRREAAPARCRPTRRPSWPRRRRPRHGQSSTSADAAPGVLRQRIHARARVAAGRKHQVPRVIVNPRHRTRS